jgi:multidrug resistance protein MdtO
MATLAQTIQNAPSSWSWFRDFLKEELSPYPGRFGIIARMTLSATLIMIICEALRVPDAFQASILALLVTRESPRATVRSSFLIAAVMCVGGLYVLCSAYLVISIPGVHFFWILISFFLTFYALSAINDYLTAVIFAIVISVAVPLWDRYVSAETNVEDTLWLILSAIIAVFVTSVVELVFVRRKPGDDIVVPLAERLTAVEAVLKDFAEKGTISAASKKMIDKLALRGTSLLRRLLRRSEYSLHYRAQMNAVVSAVGRLVDTSSALPENVSLTAGDRKRFDDLAKTLAGFRGDLIRRRIPAPIHFTQDDETALRMPLLHEMENLAALVPAAFADYRVMGEYLPTSDDSRKSKFLATDAFTNTRHAKFALKGCLAAGLCYVVYKAIDWPGISTSVTTCFLTALTTIGSSRQKQLLRFAGAVVGGFILGMGAQIFILPYIDSIFGFTILIAAVTAFSAWFLTCSPRLSYFGVQVALAFYLINLEEFTVQTSLAVARDRVVGVLLGLFAMWLVFDQLWGAPAGVEMRRAFVLTVRSIAQYVREPLPGDPKAALDRGYGLREKITSDFDTMRAMADGVLLEFGPARPQNLAWRKRIQEWSARLRTLFLTESALWKYRAQLPSFQVPQDVSLAHQEFEKETARTLDSFADRVEGKASTGEGNLQESFDRLKQSIDTAMTQQSPEKCEVLQALLLLTSRSEQIAAWLDDRIPT